MNGSFCFGCFELRVIKQIRYRLFKKSKQVTQTLPLCVTQVKFRLYLETCLPQRDQCACEIAGIHHGDIAWLEGLQGRGVNPIENVTAMAWHACQCLHRKSQPP